MLDTKIIITKVFIKPNESLEHISNKYKLIKELSIQVDWKNPEFESLWENPYLNKIISHNSTPELFEQDPSLVRKKFNLAQELKLTNSELESFHNNFEIFKNSDNSDIVDRINTLRKTKLSETLNSEEITGFHETYDSYKKVLTELKNIKINNIENEDDVLGIGANGLFKIDTPSNYFKESGILIEPRKFLVEDLKNLQLNLSDSSGNTRIEFLKDLDEDGFKKINEICRIIENLGIHYDAKNHAIGNLINHLEPEYLNKGIASGSVDYINNIMSHPDIEEIVDKLSSMFMRLPINLLDNLNILVNQHEFLTFCSIEPYMISVVGNALFFKILLPLHRQGVFSLLMVRVMADVTVKKMNAFQYMKHKYIEIHPTLVKHGIPIVAFFLGNEVTIGNQNIIEDEIELIEKEEVKEEVKEEEEKKKPLSQKIRERDKARGFTDKEGNEYFKSLRNFMYKLGVEGGKTVGVLAKGVRDGVVSEHQDDLADVVEAMEDKAENTKNKEKDKAGKTENKEKD